ncbi:tyrosine-type recombinase/integrase [Photobacterium sp. J15]|uniref:tyrosine-type recombinase/integrase n=1 Tax=Photobacterium sp. J15 TaxID=265901 RepID=UPI0007E3785A|nr:site-specific integrase [Photobacterium sp. J15]
MSKLTTKQLDAILGKPQKKRYTLSDGNGLGARVSLKGKVSWELRYRQPGEKQSRVELGNYPDVTLKIARAKAMEYRAMVAMGKDPRTELKLARMESIRPVTVKDALDYWLKTYAYDNRANAHKHERQFEKHVYPYIGDLPLKDTETRHWLEVFDRIKKVAPVAAGYIFQNCKQALRYCDVRQYATSHALVNLTVNDVGKKQSQRDRVLTDRELAELWNWLDTDTTTMYYRTLIRLLFVFGARTQEVRLSRWKEWDLKARIWTVPKEHTKNRTEIQRPIPSRVIPWLEAIRRHTGNSEFLLGEIKNECAVSQTGRNIWKRLGHASPWTLHSARHTLETKWSDMRIAPHIGRTITGHVLPGTMSIYNRSQFLLEKLEALELWLDRLELLTGQNDNVVIIAGTS